MPAPADYVDVATRVQKFYEKYPNGSLQSKVLTDDGKRIVIQAFAYRDREDQIPGIGHAEEVRGDGMVNKTSALENGETSAWGRALAALGFEVKQGIASKQEVEQAKAEEKRQAAEKPLTKSQRERLDTLIDSLDITLDKLALALTAVGVDTLDEITQSQATQLAKQLKASGPVKETA